MGCERAAAGLPCQLGLLDPGLPFLLVQVLRLLLSPPETKTPNQFPANRVREGRKKSEPQGLFGTMCRLLTRAPAACMLRDTPTPQDGTGQAEGLSATSEPFPAQPRISTTLMVQTQGDSCDDAGHDA